MKQLLPGQRVPLTVKVNASQNTAMWDGESLVVYTTAVPEKGKANEAVLKILKKQLGIRGIIVSGSTSRRKLIQII